MTRVFNQRSSPDEEFSRDVRLRAEAESPFVKVRYFFYLNGAGGAFTSLAISIARIAAAATGVNTDLMDESLRNAAIDITGLVVIWFLWQRDASAEQSRLKRATKGAELAKLTVRASKKLLGDVESGSFTTPLSSLRQGRGIEKRVVIAAAGSKKIEQVLLQAKQLQEEISLNDLLIVPVVMPRGVAPESGDDDSEWASCVALPVAVGSSWKDYVEEEAAEAIKQGVDVETDGICIILKKNGRVGQRTKGIFLENLVGNVVARREAGMDVTNI
jgi:Low psii accumulation1 / Rep27